MRYELVIPDWRPDPVLTINGRRRAQWWAQREATNTAKLRCALALRERAPLPRFTALARVTVTFGYNERRRRDVDNLTGLAKPLLDALVAEGVLRDDDTTHVELMVRAEVCGRVETRIRIEDVGEVLR